MNTLFTKTINDRSIVKPRRTIILNRIESIEDTETGEIKEVEVQTFNPTDEMLFADGWELYVLPEPTEEEILNRTKREKINEISQRLVNLRKTYDLTISIDSQYNLENNTDARNLTIDKEKYLKNIKEYKKVDSCKTVDILSVEYNSDDFKNT